jgi:hypothetical protein
MRARLLLPSAFAGTRAYNICWLGGSLSKRPAWGRVAFGPSSPISPTYTTSPTRREHTTA